MESAAGGEASSADAVAAEGSYDKQDEVEAEYSRSNAGPLFNRRPGQQMTEFRRL